MIYGQPVTFGGASGEINITDNGIFDVKKYATANVNVAPVLLWTNASPASAFAEQNVYVEKGYDAYLVEYRQSNGEAYHGVTYLPFSSTEYASGCVTYYSNKVIYFAGRVVVCLDGNIYFGIGALSSVPIGYDASGITNKNNGLGIPTRIWGVKFTL